MFIICNIIIFNLSMICLIRRINHLKHMKTKAKAKADGSSWEVS